MKVGPPLVLLVFLGLAGCSRAPEKERWVIPSGTIAFRPICDNYRAPSLGENVPNDGLVPAYLFSVNSASAKQEASLREELQAHGFSVADGTVTINRTRIVFAAGVGVLKTQQMADRLYKAMCELEQKRIRLVHVRYNSITDVGRMI